MATSITQYSITINFASDHTIGQYVNGDYWVIGPISVTSITVDTGGRNAGSEVGRDGAMINPIPSTTNMQGYDSRGSGYQSTLNKVHGGFPFTVSTGESLIASESALTPRQYSSGNNIYLETAIVLTCVDSSQDANNFRPQYCSGSKTVYSWDNVNTGLLPALADVASTPSITTIANAIQRVQLDHGIGWTMRQMHPYQNMYDYGREICKDWGNALLMALLDTADVGDNTTLLKRLIQVGIDLHGILLAGGSWPADGGHGMGRKAVIMFAGKLLENSSMRDIGFSTSFQEDGQSFYIAQIDVDTVHAPQRTDYVNDINADYIVGDIGVAEWGLRHASDRVKDDKSLSASYRTLNGPYWFAHALTMLALDIQSSYQNDAYFDYMERYKNDIGNPTSGFHANMITAYWDTYYIVSIPIPLLRIRTIPR